MTVIASFKLDKFIFAGISSCQPQCAHACFGAAAHHAYQINIGHHADDKLRHFNFQFSGRSIGSRICSLFLYRFHHRPDTHVQES